MALAVPAAVLMTSSVVLTLVPASVALFSSALRSRIDLVTAVAMTHARDCHSIPIAESISALLAKPATAVSKLALLVATAASRSALLVEEEETTLAAGTLVER